MNEYQKQALDFLSECKAFMEIRFSHIGKAEHWKDNQLREVYNFTITTPHGSYTSTFYDCVHNYQRKLEIDKKLSNTMKYGLIGKEIIALKKERETLKPREYDILACLDGYSPDTFENWCSNFGYDTDSITAAKIYIECQKQYDGLRKIFTSEQLEKLCEIC